jgi:hypothetical protein
MRALIPVILLLAATAFGCGNKSIRSDDILVSQYHPSGKDAIRDMVDRISAVNKKSPVSYAADFTIDGTIGDKTYKLLGNAQFNRKLRAMHVAFLDFIFRSPITVVFQEGDVIRIYYPVEKKLFVDNYKTIDLSNYGGISVNFDLLYSILTGGIPLIPDYTVKQGLISNDGKESMLIVENNRYYETISFNGKSPDKIKLINKSTREKFEIYMKKPILQGDSHFFANVMIVSQNTPIRLDIHFNRIHLNAPVKVKTIEDSRLPGNLKIIKM